MYFKPSYELNILSEDNFADAIIQIESQVNACKNTGSFRAFDNTNIHYEYFLAENSKKNVVIVHGLSEFSEKFYEFIYYLLNQGYNVFIYDQRCHGYSDRLTDEMDLLHVDSFYDYKKDLEQFIDQVVIPTCDLPIYLYSHSMGGGIAMLYLNDAKNRNKVEKAVLAAPLFEPVVKNVAFPIAKCTVTIANFFLNSKRKFVLSREFDPNVTYRPEPAGSQARFEYNMNLRRNNPRFRSTPMSFGWVSGSLNIGSKVLKRRRLKKVTTPILLLSAQNDKTVRNKPQTVFAQRCKTCRFVEIPDISHAVLASNEETMRHIMELILEFYA